jgi:hypothetical protein
MGERDRKLTVPKNRNVIHEAATSTTRVPVLRGAGMRTMPTGNEAGKDRGNAPHAAGNEPHGANGANGGDKRYKHG